MPEIIDDVMKVRAAADWPAAVIAGAYRTGVLGVRSLRRRGVRACCIDSFRHDSGFRSPYADARLCANPDTHPEEWLRFMADLARELGGKPILISSADQFVSAIAEHADVLSNHYVLSPGVQLQGALATKEKQYALAEAHGMPMPRTRFVSTEDDIVAFSAETMYPCLLKPIHFREWQQFPEGHPLAFTKVAIAQNAKELIESWKLAAAVNPNTIAQEIIEGPDTAKRVYLSVYSRNGQRIGNAMFRELRCDPIGFGPATVTEPVLDPETDTICDAFLRSIEYSGICEIEMKRDTRDGQVKLIEANPRLSGGGDAGNHAGVDLCWIHYLDAIGNDVIPVSPVPRHFSHIVLRSDMATIIRYRRAGLLTWPDALKAYRPPFAFFDLDAQDLRYSLETLYVTLRSAIGVIVRRWRAGSEN